MVPVSRLLMILLNRPALDKPVGPRLCDDTRFLPATRFWMRRSNHGGFPARPTHTKFPRPTRARILVQASQPKGSGPVPRALHPGRVSRKALAAGSGRENAASHHRRLAPFRSKQAASGASPRFQRRAASPGTAPFFRRLTAHARPPSSYSLARCVLKSLRRLSRRHILR
jgi:hypothetical protein